MGKLNSDEESYYFRLIYVQILYIEQMTLKDGTAAYSTFVESQVPTMTKFYFFDILSPRKIMEIHQKPILEERGP